MKQKSHKPCSSTPWSDSQTAILGANVTAALILADGAVFYGQGIGATGKISGEIVLSTAMIGTQEVLTAPANAKKIVLFTFPHLGAVGIHGDDAPRAVGLIVRAPLSKASSWTATQELQTWFEKHKIVGISGIDTRALAAHIRDHGAVKGIICHAPNGVLDVEGLKKHA